MKTGLCITTYNSPNYFEDLLYSIKFPEDLCIVAVNGGEPYPKKYENIHWIQHDKNYGAAKSRNDGLRYLMENGCDYLFISEDDMVIKSPDIFQKYSEMSQKTGFEYFCYASNAWETGPKGARTPKLQAQFSPELGVNFYQHCCNEFTFRTRNVIEKVGYYDEDYAFMFDIDYIYRLHKEGFTRFWHSPDLSNSDDLIDNNPNAISRMNSNGERDKVIGHNARLFAEKHGIAIGAIPETSRDDMVQFIKKMKGKYDSGS